MQTTENLGLKLPDLTDKVLLSDINANMETIDERFGYAGKVYTTCAQLGLDATAITSFADIINAMPNHSVAEICYNAAWYDRGLVPTKYGLLEIYRGTSNSNIHLKWYVFGGSTNTRGKFYTANYHATDGLSPWVKVGTQDDLDVLKGKNTLADANEAGEAGCSVVNSYDKNTQNTPYAEGTITNANGFIVTTLDSSGSYGFQTLYPSGSVSGKVKFYARRCSGGMWYEWNAFGSEDDMMESGTFTLCAGNTALLDGTFHRVGKVVYLYASGTPKANAGTESTISGLPFSVASRNNSFFKLTQSTAYSSDGGVYNVTGSAFVNAVAFTKGTPMNFTAIYLTS